ncbi:24751_t:CDS:1 [Cetraspora pellucida]|uniref:24751_t:CDS:1 n=1 Tax=Cetraspora pellucida TaxID=1433469 RepID=A0A9N9NQP3_9GLOM|nr:24751_t:CDS:1 [Cetraspora pellucida]
MIYYITIILSLLFIVKILKLLLLCRFYQKQEIKIITSYPIIGSELQKIKIFEKNQNQHSIIPVIDSDLIGIISGMNIQLFGINKDSCREIYNQQGVNIDRSSSSAFKKLGQRSISHTSTFEPLFKIRKNILINSIKDISNLIQISYKHFDILFEEYKLKEVINITNLLDTFIQNVCGDYFWNESNERYIVKYIDKNFELRNTLVIKTLMICFQDIYFDSKKILNQIIKFPFPLTKESYRIHKNIKNICNIFKQMIDDNEGSEVVKYIINKYKKHELSIDILLDDLIVTTSSGLNIIKLTLMSILWYLYDEKNLFWKMKFLKEIQMIDYNNYEKIAKCQILNAFIYEVLRYESSFSLLNNQVINDFDLIINSKKYKIKKGTMIMPNAYVIHHNNSSWKTHNLNIFDPTRFIGHEYIGTDFFVSFGKSIRQCPGKKYSLTIIRIFTYLFLSKYPNFKLEKCNNKNIGFSLYSNIDFNITI